MPYGSSAKPPAAPVHGMATNPRERVAQLEAQNARLKDAYQSLVREMVVLEKERAGEAVTEGEAFRREVAIVRAALVYARTREQRDWDALIQAVNE